MIPITGQAVTQQSEPESKRFEHLKTKAEKGDAEAQFNLGCMYDNGEGVEKNATEAAKWYRKAAEQGNAFGQCFLGWMYDNDNDEGVEKNAAEAAKWYRRAAEQGNAAGQSNLGWMYYRGEGVVKDCVEAYKWTLLAAAQGSTPEKEIIPSLENVMTREQIAEAQKLARDFKPPRC